MRLLRTARVDARDVAPDDRVDAADLIARALNRPVVVDEPATPPAQGHAAVDTGATIRVPLDAPAEADPLVEALLALVRSVVYDLTSSPATARWDEVVAELPSGDLATFSLDLGGVRTPWRPSRHSLGALELFRVQLEDVDPGAGYDVVVRPADLIVCRWPHRARDGRAPDPLDRPAPTGSVVTPLTGRRRGRRRRHG